MNFFQSPARLLRTSSGSSGFGVVRRGRESDDRHIAVIPPLLFLGCGTGSVTLLAPDVASVRLHARWRIACSV